MNQPSRKCIYCGKPGDMSKQHLFPDRLKHVAPRIHGVRMFGSRGRTVRSDGQIIPFEQESFKEGSIGNTKIRRVCVACNNNWLKAMEEECVPVLEALLTGEITRLFLPQQKKLATLLTSIAMTGEWLHPHHVKIDQSERASFMGLKRPLPKWSFYIGRDATGHESPRFLADGLCPTTDENGDGPRLYAAFTITIGPLLFHAVAEGEDLSINPANYGAQLCLVPIFPSRKWVDVTKLPPLVYGDIVRMRNLIRGEFVSL